MSAQTNMPTPSEQCPIGARGAENEEWAARAGQPPASIFGNFHTSDEPSPPSPSADRTTQRDSSTESLSALAAPNSTTAPSGPLLQATIDTALARSFLYRLLAKAYEDPTEANWTTLSALDQKQALRRAVLSLTDAPSELAVSAREFEGQLQAAAFEPFLIEYLAAFGHAARGRCPLNEIEYGDIKADPLFQPHRLADLAAFYRAFGLEVGDSADERQDHLCIELEFMCVLTAKEAYALEFQLDLELLETCRVAQKKFLREHLGRWVPAFARRLAQMTRGGPLGSLAKLTRAFIETECNRFGFPPGSEDLLLRPVNEAAESLCNSCGLAQPPPGAEGPQPTI